MRLIFLLLICIGGQAQVLKPGFDRDEYIGLMKLSAQFGDSSYTATMPPPREYHFLYRSPVVGLVNCWDLWTRADGLAVISLRGTTKDPVSWLSNFYAAMVPAKGQLQLSKTDNFPYELADNPRAAVHIGWLLGTAFLCKTILPKIDSLYKTGIKNIIIMGHSQGGALAYLLTAYLIHLQRRQGFPADIRLKTYCSAGPKPGNLYFAYDYEADTQGGWAYNVVNAADWVPETPVSIQTLDDFNTVNPFIHISSFIKKQKWPGRWALRYAYGRMNTPSRKAMRNYRKYLGTFVSKSVRKQLRDYQPGDYYQSMDYERAGNYVVLKPDEDYYRRFPQDGKDIFINHMHPPYIYLAEKLPACLPAR
jgi:pimeloyl-ACP methyl ester carboxylesterase